MKTEYSNKASAPEENKKAPLNRFTFKGGVVVEGKDIHDATAKYNAIKNKQNEDTTKD